MARILLFSNHADARIPEEHLTHREVLSVIANPARVSDQPHRVWYYGYSTDSPLIRVIVAKDKPIIVSAHVITGT